MSEARPLAAEQRPADERDTERLARQLGQTRRRVWLAATAIGLLLPAAWWWSGAAAALWGALAGGVPRLVAIPIFLLVFALSGLLVQLPLSWYSGFVVAHRFGLSRQTLRAWLGDWLKGGLLGLTFTVLVASGFYAALAAFGPSWWWAYGLALAAGLLLISFVLPYVIVPLFYRMQPVQDPEVARSIDRLVERAGTRVSGIRQLDFSRNTSEGNAAVIGFGRSRRVVIADTLLQEYSTGEIESIVAHELGHHVHRDVWRLLALQFVVLFLGLLAADRVGPTLLEWLGAGGLDAVANFPLLALGVELFGLALMPLVNAYSRRIEASADRYALRLTGDAHAFVSAMQHLARQNLIELRPPRWSVLLLASHPPISERIALAGEARRA